MNQIIFSDFNLGGISDSMYQGQKNSVAEMVGFDIHSEPGILKVNQIMKNETFALVDDLIKAIVQSSDGNTYFFGSTNGKIWRRTSAGVWSLRVTAAPAAGTVGIKDAWEFHGYIYYTMQSRIGRVVVGTPTDWTTRNDSWATFTKTDADFHPMYEIADKLFIGDGNLLAKIDNLHVFTDDMVLDLQSILRIRSLGGTEEDLLIGTYSNEDNLLTKIYRYDTGGGTYSLSDRVYENGINSFLKSDNIILASVGRKGNIYYYDGSQLQNYKKLPGSWVNSLSNIEAIIYHNASENRFGMTLFGLSYLVGTALKQGIYSLGGYDRNYPRVLNLEWLISSGTSVHVEIGALKAVGNNLFMSWHDNDNTVYGVDNIDVTAKIVHPYFVTKAINIDRANCKTMSACVAYRSLPTGTTINIYYQINYSGSWVNTTPIVDSIRKIVEADVDLPEANVVQIMVLVETSGNNAPEIENLIVNFE